MSTYPIKLIKTYLPIKIERLSDLQMDQAALCEACPSLKSVMELIKQSSPIGRIGKYDGVFEFNLGFEAFTPTLGARPTLGKIGHDIITPCLELQTYVLPEVPDGIVEKFLLELERIHPWEVPIIQLSFGGNTELFSSKNF
jgi:hypothetical protein